MNISFSGSPIKFQPMVSFSAQMPPVSEVKENLTKILVEQGFSTFDGDNLQINEDPSKLADIMIKTNQQRDRKAGTTVDKGLWLFTRSEKTNQKLNALLTTMSQDTSQNLAVKKVQDFSFQINNTPVSIWTDFQMSPF